MLARDVITRSGRGIRGRFPSVKMDTTVEWESPLEGDAIYHFEFSPGVSKFRAQAEKISYWDGQQFRTYYLDFLVELVCGSEVRLEIKPAKELAKPWVAEKYRRIALHYQNLGQDFRVVTDKEIRREPLLSNLKLLRRMRRYRCDELDWQMRLPELIEGASLPFTTVAERIGRNETLVLLGRTLLRCDFEQPLDGGNRITFSKGDDDVTVLL